jgi:hypothetical protein
MGTTEWAGLSDGEAEPMSRNGLRVKSFAPYEA